MAQQAPGKAHREGITLMHSWRTCFRPRMQPASGSSRWYGPMAAPARVAAIENLDSLTVEPMSLAPGSNRLGDRGGVQHSSLWCSWSC